jgi:hypothetical protein
MDPCRAKIQQMVSLENRNTMRIKEKTEYSIRKMGLRTERKREEREEERNYLTT